jgi:photosystem II stability/assembly factor-like uncharacterized protein
MRTAPRNWHSFLLVALVAATAAGPVHGQGSDPVSTAIANLEWRPIGPANMGGRVSAIEGIPGDPLVFWVGGADGGVFKTVNGGTTFEEQFTDQPTYSVGALALAPSDHNVLWLGSGEGDPRNSVSYGNGVYRSTDGGETWTHLGLDDTERIKRIVVHPHDPDVAYVCALGHEWGPNEERGVFRTTDGGASWDRVLYRDQDTGCSDMDMDQSNPRILYAGMWTFRRRPWRFDDGGKETALYKSIDGGDTWTKLEDGLPKGPMARIGVQVAQSNPNTVYLITEAKDEGVLYRSDDGGSSWRMVHDSPGINFRPFYYSDIRVDPTNPNVVYSLSGGLYKSIDGGKEFESIGGGVHGDHQAMWIDPLNSDRVLSGSDGGYQVSFDGGENWDIINNVVLSQFYQIYYDLQKPYTVCGGLQDNGSWCGPSRTTHTGGILKDDWYRVSGGDGFYAIPKPDEPHIIWTNLQGGVFMVTDMRSGGTRNVHPYPNRIGSAGDSLTLHKYRFNWDAPIHISPHDPNTVYIGGNHLFKTTDYGMSWEELSPDLTTNDPEKLRSSGGVIYQDNTAAEFHSTILTIAESRFEPGVIWVGTDDGKLQLTRDGGATWTDLTANVTGMPEFAWIAKLDASHHDPGTVYVAVDTDYGQTWTSLSPGLPQDDYVKVVREDPKNPDLLYAGMERGIQASWDGGRTWTSIRNNLPPVSVRDLHVHPVENDLIIGTHGRGAYILDDIGPLQEMSGALAEDVFLFDVRPAVRWQMGGRDASFGQRTYRAPNPPYGAYINYYLAEEPEGDVSVTIVDRDGGAIREIAVRDASAGVNRTVWNLLYDGAEPLSGQGGGGGFFGFGGGGPAAVPDQYTVTLTVGDRELETTVQVEPDPRVPIGLEDYQAQLAAGLRLRALTTRVHGVIDAVNSLQKQVTDLKGVVRQSGDELENSEEILEAAELALEKIADFRLRLMYPEGGMGYRETPQLREEIRSLNRYVMGMASRPTEAEMLRLGELETETAAAVAELNALVAGEIAALNEMLGPSPRIMVGRPDQ